MIVRESQIGKPGKGDECITEDKRYRFEDWTNLPENPHVMLRIDDDKGGYYFRTFSISRAKEEGWLYVGVEDREG